MSNTPIEVDPTQIAHIIKSRKTLKVLQDVNSPTAIAKQIAERNRPIILESLKVAGWAPFHYDRGKDGIVEPWRAHVVWHDQCRNIAKSFHDLFDDVKPNNKLPKMLSGCGALVLINWVPQFRSGSSDEDLPREKQLQIDEEHLAATSALVQNFLLLLTAHGMGTYWSSGGQFRTSKMFDRLGIDPSERLLAAVFVEFPETIENDCERVPGKHRESRSDRWIREVDSIN